MSRPSGAGDAGAAGGSEAVGPDGDDVESLIGELGGLVTAAETAGLDDEVRETQELLAVAGERGLIDSGFRRLRLGDAAEAFVGSVIFASPLLVEDGVFDIADHLFQFTVAGVPVFLVANTLFVVVMTYALLEWTGRDRTETRDLLGVVPVRLLMVLAVSFVVSAALMTVWGRVDGWQPPAAAVARVNVLWTVGSLGAALGDVVSNGDPHRHEILDVAGPTGGGTSDAAPTVADRLSDPEIITSLDDQFDDIGAAVRSEELRLEVERIRERTFRAAGGEQLGQRIRKYTSRDVAEAFVGSVFFSIPFLVEDGVFDVAEYFLSFRVGQFPAFFLLNAAFVLLMVLALVYWAGPRDVHVSRPLFGVVPRRLVGISVVSFVTAAALMTMWGRVGDWQDPVVAVARISVVWTIASFGAALGDILPGESSGDDINDDLAELGELIGEAAAPAERER